ncbi:MAG: hypothetical protein NT149_01250, partial [Candidatus Gottesmanbacteria bacterium]|nr:hypothetical protein [Candidatus Gottesmanbacteria bacterium]
MIEVRTTCHAVMLQINTSVEPLPFSIHVSKNAPTGLSLLTFALGVRRGRVWTERTRVLSLVLTTYVIK